MNYALIPPDELVSVCLQTGDESAWVEFVRRFHPLIARAVIRVARQWCEPSPQVIDDLIQDTYLKLCVNRSNFLQKFRPNHQDAVFGYIKVFTANLVHDHFKALHSQKRGRNLTSALSEDHDPDETGRHSLSGAEAIERNVLIGQIDTALSTLDTGTNSQRDRRIFWLHYRVGLSASAIAAVPGIGLTTKGVESTLLRLTRHVKQKLCQERESPCEGAQENKGIRPAESF